MQSQGATAQEMAKKFRIRKFDEQRLFAASLANYELGELLRKHKKIADADLAIKSGKKNPLLALETLVISLCRQGS
jgi:DNA polymerase III delta subunit